VYGKHVTHDIFVDFDAKSVIDLLGNADTTELSIAALHLDDGRDELCGRAFRSGLSLPMGRGEQQKVVSMDQRLWNLNSVAGLIIADSIGMRCGLTKRVVSPSTRRSSMVRFGARCRERLLIMS
jgi:hypothetical protein